jgi:hypothetical protein
MWLSAHSFSDNSPSHRIFLPMPFLDADAVMLSAQGRIMIDPDSRVGRELKAADEVFALARAAPTPFMRSYYQRVAERYLSSKGDLRAVERLGVSSTRASMS